MKISTGLGKGLVELGKHSKSKEIPKARAKNSKELGKDFEELGKDS